MMTRARAYVVFWVVVAVLLAADLVVYLVLLRPPGVAARPETEALASLEQQVAQIAQEVQRLRRIEQELPATRKQLDDFLARRFLSQDAGYSRVVDELERAATDSGVRPGRADFRTHSVREQPELVREEITTTVEGGYVNLLRFLEHLERSPNFYLLERLGLVSSAASGSLKLDLTIHTYFRQART